VGLTFFIQGIFPYISIAVLVLGITYRVWYWFTRPVPLRIGLAPIPTTWRGVVNRIAAEVLLFVSLFRSERLLWYTAYGMHVAALLVLSNHALGIADGIVDTFTPYYIPGAKTILFVLACFAFPLIAALLFLLIRRIQDIELNRITVPADYVALSLILLHVLGGAYMSFFTEVDLGAVAAWGLGLATFRPSLVYGSWIFTFHCATGFTLFMYFPFSKLLHPLGMIVNRWTMTPKEEPLVPGGVVVK